MAHRHSADPAATPTDPPREFALEVVRRLREAGFHALWAGGCVRDAVLGRTPKDYDVATTAAPEDVIRLFGRQRTVPVGVSFGVVMVLGPNRSSGQIEVATFRSDGNYLDGRRPSHVRFCTPEEDALRRDFTINGMFFDPLEDRVIDYVGGREDLAAGIVRAIGNPAERFSEDKLRILRAVRFAATFGFELDPATAAAARALRHSVIQVSVERISQELRRMLAHFSRARTLRLLDELLLLPILFPRVFGTETADPQHRGSLTARTEHTLAHLTCSRFEPALTALLLPLYEPDLPPGGRGNAIAAECRQLRLSGDEVSCVVWLADGIHLLQEIQRQPLHILKPLLSNPRVELLLDLSAALALGAGEPAVDATWCRSYLSRTPAEQLSPPPLIDGAVLLQLGIPAGPQLGQLLATIRREQLDELLDSTDTALARLRVLTEKFPAGRFDPA